MSPSHNEPQSSEVNREEPLKEQDNHQDTSENQSAAPEAPTIEESVDKEQDSMEQEATNPLEQEDTEPAVQEEPSETIEEKRRRLFTKRTSDEAAMSAKERYLARKRAKISEPVIAKDD